MESPIVDATDVGPPISAVYKEEEEEGFGHQATVREYN